MTPNSGTNCTPLNVVCRIGRWNGSITFSQSLSQLVGTISTVVSPPPPVLAPSATRRSPGAQILEPVVARQRRLLGRRAHIGEDEAVAFLERIPGLADFLALAPALGLARLIEAASLHVEEPAVIAAADAVILDPPVIERRAAMAAARIEQAGPARCGRGR